MTATSYYDLILCMGNSFNFFDPKEANKFYSIVTLN